MTQTHQKQIEAGERLQASELRIGNYVQYGNPIHKDLPIHKITGVTTGNIWLDGEICHINNSNITGIPLTPEILERCGFDDQGILQHGMFYICLREGYSSMANFKIHLTNRLSGVDVPLELTYLHQLQNLYYALTGHELILKA